MDIEIDGEARTVAAINTPCWINIRQENRERLVDPLVINGYGIVATQELVVIDGVGQSNADGSPKTKLIDKFIVFVCDRDGTPMLLDPEHVFTDINEAIEDAFNVKLTKPRKKNVKKA